MLRSVKDLRSYAIRATDGVIGKVDDLYFDDELGHPLSRRLTPVTGCPAEKCSISPIALGYAGWMGQAPSCLPDEGASGGSPTLTLTSQSRGSTKPSTSDTTGTRFIGAAQAYGAWAHIRAV